MEFYLQNYTNRKRNIYIFVSKISKIHGSARIYSDAFQIMISNGKRVFSGFLLLPHSLSLSWADEGSLDDLMKNQPTIAVKCTIWLKLIRRTMANWARSQNESRTTANKNRRFVAFRGVQFRDGIVTRKFRFPLERETPESSFSSCVKCGVKFPLFNSVRIGRLCVFDVKYNCVDIMGLTVAGWRCFAH